MARTVFVSAAGLARAGVAFPELGGAGLVASVATALIAWGMLSSEIDAMSSGISNRRAEEAAITRLFRELAQMEPVEIDLQVLSDDQTRQLVGLLRRVLGHINEHLE